MIEQCSLQVNLNCFVIDRYMLTIVVRVLLTLELAPPNIFDCALPTF